MHSVRFVEGRFSRACLKRDRMRWPRTGAIRTPNARRSKPRFSRASGRRPPGVAGGFTSTASWHRVLGPRFPVPRKRWVKNCIPTGVAAEQTSNIARGTPRHRRSRVCLPNSLQDREVLSHAGPMWPGVPRALQGQDGNSDEGASRADTKIGSAELCISASTRVWNELCP